MPNSMMILVFLIVAPRWLAISRKTKLSDEVFPFSRPLTVGGFRLASKSLGSLFAVWMVNGAPSVGRPWSCWRESPMAGPKRKKANHKDSPVRISSLEGLFSK